MSQLSIQEKIYNFCESNYNEALEGYESVRENNPNLNIRDKDLVSLKLFNGSIKFLLNAKVNLDLISEDDLKNLYKEKNIKKIEDTNLVLDMKKLLHILILGKTQLYFNHIDDIAQKKGYQLSEENNLKLAALCREQVVLESKEIAKLFSSKMGLKEVSSNMQHTFPVHLLDELNLKNSEIKPNKAEGTDQSSSSDAASDERNAGSSKSSDTASDEDYTTGTSEGSPSKGKIREQSSNKKVAEDSSKTSNKAGNSNNSPVKNKTGKKSADKTGKKSKSKCAIM